MKKLKIGFVVDDTLDKTDGVQQYVLTVGSWLAKNGHEVHYIVGQTKRTDIPNIHSVARNVAVKFNQNNLSIPLPANGKKIRQLLQHLDLDILHIQAPYSPMMAAKVIRLAPEKTKIIGTFHILPFSRFERIATHILGMFMRRNVRRISVMLAVSEPARQFAEETYRLPARVIPNAVDIAQFQSNMVADAKKPKIIKIVFLGRLVPRKGAVELLQAVAQLPKEYKEQVRIFIGGKGPLTQTLEGIIHTNKLDAIVELVGFVDESKKADFLGSADIAVFPSISGESFGIVLIEAMAAGAGVVIGGDNPGYRTVLGDCPECIIDPKNVDLFSDKLLQFMSDTSLRQNIHHKQQRALQNYDIQRIGPRLLKEYQRKIAEIIDL